MIDKIFWYRVAKIKEVKYYAKDRNIPIWYMPVLDAVMLCFLGSIYLSDFLIASIPPDGVFQIVSPYLPFLLFALAFLTVIDLVAKGMVHVHQTSTKLVQKIIQKIDYLIWKKTKKDNVISTGIWRVQSKYMKLSKSSRKRLSLLFIMLIILYVTLRLF